MRGFVAGLLLCGAAPLAAQVPMVRVIDASTGRVVEDSDVRALGTDSLIVRALGYRPARVARGTTAVALSPLALALDRIVVTAAKREQKLADAVVTTEVISAGDIARTGASDLASALVASTGIELAGGIPSGAGVMLQGLSSSRVLILLDGQPMPGRIGGDFDLSRLPTSVVDRVEVVKGAQSALYGTDAMGGVVNIITRRPLLDGRALGANVALGSRSRMDGSLTGDVAFGDLSLRGEAGRRSVETTPGRSREVGALSERLDGAASAQWRASTRTTLDVSALGLDERQRWLSGTLYNFGDNLQLSTRARLVRDDMLGGRVSFTGFGSSYDHLSRASSQPQPIRGDTGQRQVQRLFQGELAYSAEMAGVLVDAALLARQDDTRSARVPGGRRSLATLEPSLQVETPIGADVSLVTGARVSRSERWGMHFTPRVALRWDAAPALTLRASAGSGFRAPDFRELYLRFVNESAAYAIYGNENLAPERSRNFSLGAEWSVDAGYIRTQLYHNRFDGFIEEALVSAPNEPLVFIYQNVDDGYTRGVEVEGATVSGRLRLDAGYAFLESRDFRTGQSLSGRPKHSARATVASPLALGVRGSVSGIFTGRTFMQSVDGSASWRDAYPRFDLRLARALAGGAEMTFNVENVLDRRPVNWAGYAARQFVVGLSWRVVSE
jgi:outer membrane receptor for ferrienterochelin and colicins